MVDFLPHFKLQRVLKEANLEEFFLLYADAEEQEKYHAPDAVFGRFFYYEEMPTDMLEKSYQCRLIIFEDFDKTQVEDLLGEILFRLGMDESVSATDVFFALRDRGFSLFREVSDEEEEEDDDGRGIFFPTEHKELDAERLTPPGPPDDEDETSSSKSKKING